MATSRPQTGYDVDIDISRPAPNPGDKGMEKRKAPNPAMVKPLEEAIGQVDARIAALKEELDQWVKDYKGVRDEAGRAAFEEGYNERGAELRDLQQKRNGLIDELEEAKGGNAGEKEAGQPDPRPRGKRATTHQPTRASIPC